MKKIFLVALVALATGTSAFAEPGSSISTKALSHIASSYKEAKDIQWVSTTDFDKVSFTIGAETVNTFYNSFGDLIGTSKTMAFDKLPKAAIETITTKYTFPDYQLKECIQFVNADKNTNYYVSMETSREKLVLEIAKNGTVRIFNRTSR